MAAVNVESVAADSGLQGPSDEAVRQLFDIATCSTTLETIKQCISQITTVNEEFTILTDFVIKCQATVRELESERKTHAEELRLINQDINHLEDMLKGVKESHKNHRQRLGQKCLAFRNRVFLVNKMCQECGINNENLLNYDLVPLPAGFDEPRIPQPNFPSQPVVSMPSMTMPMMPPGFNRPTGFGPFGAGPGGFMHERFGLGLKMPQAVRGLPPRPFGTFLEDVSKLKNCQACNRKIHRNAPVCPLCKCKNSSRNRKSKK